MSKPNITIPTEFATNGTKTDFSASKISNGFDRINPDVLAGDNLNKFIDDTYKGLNGTLELFDGCVIYDAAITYNNKSIVFYINADNEVELYRSLVNNNTGNSLTDTAKWQKLPLENIDKHALKAYLDKGELLTDLEGFSDVYNYAHSTYNASVFTPKSSVTVTTDGIASNFSSSNNVETSAGDISQYSSWKIKVPFKYSSTPSGTTGFFSVGGAGVKSGTTYNANNNKFTSKIYIGNNSTLTVETTYVVSPNVDYYTVTEFTGTAYVLSVLDEDGNILTTNSTESSTNIYSGIDFRVGLLQSGSPFTNGVIDLKKISITSEGSFIFNGNKTGTDTYTISGSTVTITYNLSSTGSKVCDKSQRASIASLYTEQGYAPYFSIDEDDLTFTLPQGEIYGMINTRLDGEWVYSSTSLNSATAVDTYSIDLSNILPQDNFNYLCVFKNQISRTDNNNGNSTIAFTVNGNNVFTATRDGGASSTDTKTERNQFQAVIDTTRVISMQITKSEGSADLATQETILLMYKRLGKNK